MSLPRVALLCDLLEENWPSMDLVAEMLFRNLRCDYSSAVQALQVCPPMARRFTRLPYLGKRRAGYNADRLLNRFWDYPRLLRGIKSGFDLFHVVDHSYAQLIHELPPGRSIVTCHDLDTFRCLLDPAGHPRSKVFRAAARRSLLGLCKAARVTCDSMATRDELQGHRLLPPDRVTVVPNGVHPSCSAEPDALADLEAARLLGPVSNDGIEILHVGSTVPRKRLDVLLKVFASVRAGSPHVRLIRVGGPFTAAQQTLLDRLKLAHSVLTLPFLGRDVLAAVYRRASLVLCPSDREGFGLPVIEAMACGTPVLSSDLPVLKEVGGEAASYCPVGDAPAWAQAVAGLLGEKRERPAVWSQRRLAGIARARQFSWKSYTAKMVDLYREVLYT